MSVNKKEYLALTYFISRVFFLGVGFTFIYRSSGKDSWIAILAGYLVGNIIIILYDKIAKKIDYNLNNFFNLNNIFSKLYKLIFFLLYIFIIYYSATIFTNFVKVYYLFDTPIWATLLLLFGITYYSSTKNEATLIRTSLILFPISIAVLICNNLLLIPITNTSNFLPILTTSNINLATSSMIFVLFSSLPNILLIEYKISLKSKLISYAFVTMTILSLDFFITGVLGEYLITTYSYPEYMVLRRIRFLDFIENVENFASIIWYFDSFIIITLALLKIKKLVPSDKNKFVIPIILLGFVVVSYIYFSKYFSILSSFLENGVLIFLISIILTCPILFLLTSYYFKQKK